MAYLNPACPHLHTCFHMDGNVILYKSSLILHIYIVMYAVEDTASRWSNIYFLLITIFCSLFVLNIVVAVIVVTFSNNKAEIERANSLKKMRVTHRNLFEEENKDDNNRDEFETKHFASC